MPELVETAIDNRACVISYFDDDGNHVEPDSSKAVIAKAVFLDGEQPSTLWLIPDREGEREKRIDATIERLKSPE